jgi:hypothetical protein
MKPILQRLTELEFKVVSTPNQISKAQSPALPDWFTSEFAQSALENSVDWNNWKPGNAAAEALLRPSGGLKKLLKNLELSSKSMEGTSYDIIGNKLADGIALGVGYDDMASMIEDSIGAPERALMIATTEGSRAVNTAAMDSYRYLGVEQIEWVALDPCSICDIDGEIVNIDEPFSNGVYADNIPGDAENGTHPNCRCSIDLVPASYLTDPAYDYLDEPAGNSEMAVTADLNKYNENHDELGRFSSDDEERSPVARSPEWAKEDYKYLLKDQGELDASAKYAAQNWQGDGYKQIQSALLGGNPSGEVADTIDILDSNMKTFKDPEGELTYPELYRGQTEGLDNLKVGDSFKSKTYQATTTDPIQAAGFTKSSGNVLGGVREGESATILRINVVTAKGFVIPDSPENEVLLARNTKFTVDTISTETINGVNMKVIDVTAKSR